MIGWDGRMRDNHSVKILKAVVPFLDVEVGERIDIEGILSAVRPFAGGRERRMLDLCLQFFQMKRMMEMMQMVQSMQQMQGFGGGSGGGGSSGEPSPAMFEMLKTVLPPEQQDMFDMLSTMMAMSEDISPRNAPDNQKDGLSEEMSDIQRDDPLEGMEDIQKDDPWGRMPDIKKDDSWGGMPDIQKDDPWERMEDIQKDISGHGLPDDGRKGWVAGETGPVDEQKEGDDEPINI